MAIARLLRPAVLAFLSCAVASELTPHREYVGPSFARSLQRTLDRATKGMAFSIPTLSPFQPDSIPGTVFLLTNVPFFVAGARLMKHAQFAFGTSLGVAGTLSHTYHHTQLSKGGEEPETALALLADYGGAASATAGTARAVAARGGVAFLAAQRTMSACFAVGAVSFVGGWFTDPKRPEQYLWLHGVWHVCTAAAVYQLAAL